MKLWYRSPIRRASALSGMRTAASISSRTSLSDCSRNEMKEPMRERSAGMTALFSQAPLA